MQGRAWSITNGSQSQKPSTIEQPDLSECLGIDHLAGPLSTLARLGLRNVQSGDGRAARTHVVPLRSTTARSER